MTQTGTHTTLILQSTSTPINSPKEDSPTNNYDNSTKNEINILIPQGKEFVLTRLIHDTCNNITENDENLSLDEELNTSEEMNILSSGEESNLYNITKATRRPKRLQKQHQYHF